MDWMHFITFPVGGTNIFPISNSKAGGQLVTEWNLRSREMVGTSSAIKYQVGPSYVHSADDFEVRVLQDNTGTQISSSTLEVLPGRGVINGHYVETLVPMIVDLAEANYTRKTKQLNPFSGQLEIGIRIFYSTEATMAGAMLVENTQDMYEGVQLVIAPKLVLPIESPTDQTKVTAHIRLARFTYLNGTITSITNCNDEKCKYLSADRIANIDMLLSDSYIKKSGLNPNFLYVFAGKGTKPDGSDFWCRANDSLMIWDNNPTRGSMPPSTDPQLCQANFHTLGDKVVLRVPHKQIEGMIDNQGQPEYYQPRLLELPVADYNNNTPGVVDTAYTSHIKAISAKLNTFHQTVKGKQVYYLESRSTDTELPAINTSWEIGDYILVGQDYTVDESVDSISPPSTMYVVIPGVIKSLKYLAKVDNSDVLPASLTGVQLGYLSFNSSDGDPVPSTSADPVTYPQFYQAEDNIRGVVGHDYFVATYINGDMYTKYYYVVSDADSRKYSNPILITGQVPLATEEVIGGFLNVSDTDPAAHDAGYVFRDEYGRLRLMDYGLLRSGTLAYQLGEEVTVPSGLTTAEIQSYLDNYVNQRIAFPNGTHNATSDTPNVIDVYITLPEEEASATLYIYDIDSRFNTSVYIHIDGQANNNTTINILDCERIRIDNNISGTPTINIYRSCLYYDAAVFDYIRKCNRNDLFTGFSDIKLWYAMFEDSDPNLVVDNLTVRELDAPIVSQDIEFWNSNALNDNHYRYALHSITFAGNGDITGCSMLVSNQSTYNIEPGHSLIRSTFELPQGSGLVYPKSCMNKQLKITGTFVSAYKSDSWVVTDTNFTALTSTYSPYDLSTTTQGSIAFHANTNLIQANVGDVIEEWAPDTYHVFQGGAIS